MAYSSFIVCSYGGLEDNSYIATAAANTLIPRLAIYYDEWAFAAADPRRQEAALAAATRDIDSLNWAGSRYYPQQALEFPRVPEGYSFPVSQYGEGPDASFYETISIDDYFARQRRAVERAVCHQALYLLRLGGERAHRESQHEGLAGISKSHRFGDSASYREPSFILCPEASDALRAYKGYTRVVRGGGTGGPYGDL